MIIGFSGKALAGKDTAADYLISKYGWVDKLGFSYNLKDACCKIFGFDEDQVHTQKGKSSVLSNKIIVDFNILSYIIDWMHITHPVSIYSKDYSNLIGKELSTVREVLQFVGTDVMRFYWPSYHVDVVKDKALRLALLGDGVAVVDVRFQNEADSIKSIGGCLVRINRPDNLKVHAGFNSNNAKHESEIALDNKKDWDYIINNDSDCLESYYKQLNDMLVFLRNRDNKNAINDR